MRVAQAPVSFHRGSGFSTLFSLAQHHCLSPGLGHTRLRPPSSLHPPSRIQGVPVEWVFPTVFVE